MSATPSAQYRLTIRVKIDDSPGMLGHVTDRDRRGRRHRRRRRPGRGRRPGQSLRDIVVDASGREHWERIIAAIGALDGAEVIDTTDRTFLLHVGRQDRTAQQAPAEDARRPLDGLHAGRRARLPGDRRRRGQGLPVHDQAQHGGRRLRRHRGARTRRHRPRGGDAGDGGQVLPVQGVRRRRRVPDLPGHDGPRRDRAHRQADRAGVRRHQPRGHLRAALLRDRGAAEAGARHPRVPRRPARHRRRRDGGAAERRQADRTEPRGPERAGHRARRGRHRGDEDPARGRRDGDHRRRLPRRAAHPARGLPRRLDELDQALVRRGHQPRLPIRAPRPT